MSDVTRLISVKVKTRAKKPGVKKLKDGSFYVSVKSPPENGAANNELIRILSDELNVPQADISITMGHTSTMKVVGIACTHEIMEAFIEKFCEKNLGGTR